MKVTYINKHLDPSAVAINNIAHIEHERVNRFDTEYDIISCVKYENGNTIITELDLIGDTKIVIERD